MFNEVQDEKSPGKLKKKGELKKMSKIVIDCENPNDLLKMEEALQKAAGRCIIAYAKQADHMLATGEAKSIREAAKKIAEEEGNTTAQTVRRRIQRGKQAAQGGPQKNSPAKKPEKITIPKSFLSDELFDLAKEIVKTEKHVDAGGEKSWTSKNNPYWKRAQLAKKVMKKKVSTITPVEEHLYAEAIDDLLTWCQFELEKF